MCGLPAIHYEAQKGFAEDLDEGKFSFPIIHSIGNETPNGNCTLRTLLRRKTQGQQQHGAVGFGHEPSDSQKHAILRLLEDSGSME
jgi:hypothetical protein